MQFSSLIVIFGEFGSFRWLSPKNFRILSLVSDVNLPSAGDIPAIDCSSMVRFLFRPISNRPWQTPGPHADTTRGGGGGGFWPVTNRPLGAVGVGAATLPTENVVRLGPTTTWAPAAFTVLMTSVSIVGGRHKAR